MTAYGRAGRRLRWRLLASPVMHRHQWENRQGTDGARLGKKQETSDERARRLITPPGSSDPTPGPPREAGWHSALATTLIAAIGFPE